MSNKYPKSLQYKLVLQKLLCYFFVLFTLPFFYLIFSLYFRVDKKNLKKIRAEFRALAKQSSSPILICPNHLTFIDSFLITILLSPGWRYLFHFKTYSWNMPTFKHLSNNLFFLVVCYLCKCQIIDKKSTAKIQKAMQAITCLLSQGNYVTLFIEGTRSRSGKVNTQDFMYGVGNILQEVPHARTLCVYMRGLSQKSASNFPKIGEQLYCALKPIEPKTNAKGARGARDISTQIVNTLAQMEQEYFDTTFVSAEQPILLK